MKRISSATAADMAAALGRGISHQDSGRQAFKSYTQTSKIVPSSQPYNGLKKTKSEISSPFAGRGPTHSSSIVLTKKSYENKILLGVPQVPLDSSLFGYHFFLANSVKVINEIPNRLSVHFLLLIIMALRLSTSAFFIA